MHIAPDGYKTRLNWQKEWKKPKHGKAGTEFWCNFYCQDKAIYYSPDEVRDMTEKEIEKSKDEQRKIRRKKRAEKKRKDEEEKLKNKYDDGYYDGYDKGFDNGKIEALKESVYGTAREWLRRGRKVIDDCKHDVVSGDEKFKESYGFFYYHILDTIECSVDEARMLLNDWNNKVLRDGEKYCGLKWWKNKDDED